MIRFASRLAATRHEVRTEFLFVRFRRLYVQTSVRGPVTSYIRCSSRVDYCRLLLPRGDPSGSIVVWGACERFCGCRGLRAFLLPTKLSNPIEKVRHRHPSLLICGEVWLLGEPGVVCIRRCTFAAVIVSTAGEIHLCALERGDIASDDKSVCVVTPERSRTMDNDDGGTGIR